MPILLPSGVTVSVDPEKVVISGGKGSLSQFTMSGIKVAQEGDTIVVTRDGDDPTLRARHGLMRALINNMVNGVSQGFSRQLEINGVGYRVSSQGNGLKFNLGFSHDVMYTLPEGITAKVEQNVITVSGIDRQKVGQVAAEIRALKKPEPYKGKGIAYVGERIVRKSGKSGKDK